MATLNYLEMPVGDVPVSRRFYTAAFGWTFADYGPDYAAYEGGQGADVGLNGDRADAMTTPLPVIEVDDLEATLAAVERAGGRVVRPIFAFPGGQRFHFADPHGNMLAAYAKVEEETKVAG